MRAVQTVAPGAVEVRQLPEPERGAVLIRPELVGICGTDVKVLEGRIPVHRPLTMGHEAVGRVVRAAPDSGFAEGDRVLVDPAVTCGRCALCQARRPHLCTNGGLLGRDVHGVFSELVPVDPERLLPVPETVSDRASGLLQVLGTCVHAQRAVQVFPGQVAAVIGLGVAGQLMVQLLRERGVEVVGITRSEWKLELARGAGTLATATPDRAAEVLADVTGGRGPTLVVEAAGTERTLAQSIELAAVGGEVLVFGTITGGDEGLPYYQLYLKELTLYNPRAALIEDYATGISLAAAGGLDLEQLVTHVFGMDDAAAAFDATRERDSLKVLMDLSDRS